MYDYLKEAWKQIELNEASSEPKVVKSSQTKNYKVRDYKNPPDKDIEKETEGEDKGKPKYRSKKVKGKNGKTYIIKFAIKKKKGPEGGKTQMTSKWMHKSTRLLYNNVLV